MEDAKMTGALAEASQVVSAAHKKEEDRRDNVPAMPCETLYCRGLDDRIHPRDIIANLYDLFIPFGDVAHIHAERSKKLRGQAFVSFRDITAASAALQKLQGAILLGRSISIQYAYSKSNIIAAAENVSASKRRKAQDNAML